MTDVLAFFDPEIAIPLVILGGLFGALVLWHFPNARLSIRAVLFLLVVADVLPWLFIITFRGIEFESGSDPTFAGWYKSIGTALMFLGFDFGAVAGIAIRERIHAHNASRAAVLPHGVHHRIDP